MTQRAHGTSPPPTRPTTVTRWALRWDYNLSRNNSLLVRYLRSETDSVTPPTTRPIGTVAKATLQDVMASDTHIFTPRTINVARFSYNRIGASPQATSGLSNSDYGINVPQNVPIAAGLANISLTGFFSVGDAQQPFVSRLNEVSQFTDDVTWVFGRHSTKFGLDVRQEHMVINFVNRPNGDFTFTGSTTARSGNALADFLLGLPAQFRRATQNTAQDGKGWLYSAYVAGRVPTDPAGDDQRGCAIRAADPLRGRERCAQLVPPWPAVNPLSRVRRSVSSIPEMQGCPPARTTPTRTTSRHASASCGIRPARAGRACAAHGASSTTRSQVRATSSRTACSRRHSRRCSRSIHRRPR